VTVLGTIYDRATTNVIYALGLCLAVALLARFRRNSILVQAKVRSF
jgi:hypothetical protein